MGATRLTEIMVGVTGIVMPYALATPPQGWLLCDGSPLAAGTADRLRDRLIGDGSLYGSDGGNPRLPDLRGEFVRGLDAGRNIDAGRVLGSAQADELKAHGHAVNVGNTGFSNASSGGSSQIHQTGYSGATAAATGGNETRPRNVAMNYIIKT